MPPNEPAFPAPRPGGRAARRRQLAPHATTTANAFFSSALDGKVHIVMDGRLKTLCGRHAIALPPAAGTRKNRCPTCARALA